MSVFVLLALACEGPATAPPAAPAPPPAPAPVAAPTPAPAPAAAAPERERVAKVKEVLAAGDYTIARMDACGQEAWVAGPKTDLKVDGAVVMPMGTPMTDFEAKSLGRTFEEILFVDWIRPTDQEPSCPPPPSPEHVAERPPPADPADTMVGVVKETMQAGGYTYARLDLCGKERWIAGPPVPLNVGETAKVSGAFTMKGFKSPTLGRTFDELDMVTRITIAGAPPKCP